MPSNIRPKMPPSNVSSHISVLLAQGISPSCADMRFFYPALRERLLATVQTNHIPDHQHHRPEHQLSHTAGLNTHIIDPAIAGSGMMNPHAGVEGSGGDDSPDVRRGKRELSTSKRAAQNRAAQVRPSYSATVTKNFRQSKDDGDCGCGNGAFYT